jgi:exo-beta-1,3-glucanase (GH17 family)
MDFSPYVDGQDPNFGTQITEAQLTARLQIIANNTVWARSFGCTHGLEKFGTVAHSLGLKAAVGAWLSSNTTANNQEIANLVAAANAGQVDLAIVGSEVLLRNDLTETQLIAYMNQVRQQIPANIPVATADVYGKLLEHPAVIAACDVVLPNYYPYWEGVSIDTSIATLHRQHQLVVAAAQGKPVIVSETGWPSAGNVICNAVPSAANASLYFLNFVSWAKANNVAYFYFTSLSENWKANYEGPQGAHWGVWTKDGVLKPGMQAVFDGQTMADNWTNAGVPGGPGSPSIQFSYVPPYGSFNNLFGQVFHVNTDDYKVAVYIYVGGWWTKPTFAAPLTNIGLDGGWECDITTGGTDQNATDIVAYLIPNSFSPPPMSGGQTLPTSLDQNSVAKTEIARSSSSLYVAGRVTDGSNQGINCVTIDLSGSQTATTHTVSNGNYAFLNLQAGGNYTVTPSLPGYTFSPPSSTFNNLGNNQTANFVALPIPPGRANVALTSNGGTTTASSTLGGYPSSRVNDGDRKGASGGLWADSTQSVFPDWVEVDFNGMKTLTEIDLITMQDNYSNPTEPALGQTFNLYGATAFDMQYWDGGAWVTVPGGSVSGNNKVWRQFIFAPITTNKVRALINANPDNSYSRVVEFEAWGTPSGFNVALAVNGGTTTASSTLGGYPSSRVNDGDRKGVSGGIWADGTQSVFPDWIEVDFNGMNTLTEIDLVTMQDNYSNPAEPALGQTFNLYGATAFDVQYWDGSGWVTVPGGSVTGNNKVWRQFAFSPLTTSKVRIMINAGADNSYSRVVELEAWGRPVAINAALPVNGGTTTASSTLAGYPSSRVNDGDRKGASGGIWADGTQSIFPDWIEVDFSGMKTLTEIDLVTLQDNYGNPSEPTLVQTFNLYGTTAFDVQYWNGSAWVTVPGGSVTGNNKVWRQFTFAPITTNKVRVTINAGADNNYSRVVELEAWAQPGP